MFRRGPRILKPAGSLRRRAVRVRGSRARRREARLRRGGLPARRDRSAVVAHGDLKGQARAVLDNLRTALEAAGSSIEQVLKTTVYVASGDRADLVRVWQVVEAGFAPARPPSTLLGVAALGYEGQLVEVEAIALAGPD